MKKILSIVLCLTMILTVFTACGSGSTASSTVSNSSSSVNPSTSPSTSPSASPDGSKPAESALESGMTNVELTKFKDKIKEVYGENYIPDRMLTEEEIMERTGLKKDMFAEVFAEASTLDENPDIFVAVKANSGKADEVEQCLKKYKDKMLADNKFEANREKITASEIVKNGDHVFLILLGANEFGTEDQNIGESFKKEIQKGVDAIKNMFA